MNPDNHRQYRNIAETLRMVGHLFSSELPISTASLHLYLQSGSATLDVYNREGKLICRLPDLRTSQSFRQALERLASARCPDPSGIVCPLILK